MNLRTIGRDDYYYHYYYQKLENILLKILTLLSLNSLQVKAELVHSMKTMEEVIKI